jgi:hypothetical protein
MLTNIYLLRQDLKVDTSHHIMIKISFIEQVLIKHE